MLGPFVGQAYRASIDATSLSAGDTFRYDIFISEGAAQRHGVCWRIPKRSGSALMTENETTLLERLRDMQDDFANNINDCQPCDSFSRNEQNIAQG